MTSRAVELSWDDLAEKAASRGLWAVGGFTAETTDDLPVGTQSVVLLSPHEPEFWPVFQAAPEYQDDRPDPLDRWSRRVIGTLACDLGAKALFPFAGPPWRPFLAWALRSGQFHQSPVGMLVHPRSGLWASLRGALALKTVIDLPQPVPSPCDGCVERPCLTACPVGALGDPRGYDISACHGFLDSPPGDTCMTSGCRARQACPVSASYPRSPSQSAFHMKSFHPKGDSPADTSTER